MHVVGAPAAEGNRGVPISPLWRAIMVSITHPLWQVVIVKRLLSVQVQFGAIWCILIFADLVHVLSRKLLIVQ